MINTLNSKRTKKSWDPTPKIPATLSTLFTPTPYKGAER